VKPRQPTRHELDVVAAAHSKRAGGERYWLTIATSAHNEGHALERARVAALQVDGSIVDVQREPPQGSTIVGDMHEDELG
jgi:hypothetical protein